jgi:AcrR family transcriptional regulator
MDEIMETRNTYHHGDLKNALIQAGIEILAQEGVGGLTLRKVAKKAGVSHAAPYAHFADKQALIAAISTEGFNRLYAQIEEAVQQHAGDPLRQLVEVAWAYVQFARRDPAHFKITLSGVLEKEKDYPACVEISQRSFQQVVQLVETCQAAGVLKPGPSDLMAASLWSAVHGFTALHLEGQFSHALQERVGLRGMLVFMLDQLTIVEIPPEER